MNISRYSYAIAGILLLTTVGIASPPLRKAAAGMVNVFVTNTSANPVPTAAQGVTQVAGSVNVSASTALPVQDINSSARTAVTFHLGVTLLANDVEDAGPSSYTVPAGKRLVVQSLFASSFQVPPGEVINEIGMGQEYGNAYYIPIQHQGSDTDGYEHYVGSAQGPIYFEAGAKLRALAVRNSGSDVASAGVEVNGYLENAS